LVISAVAGYLRNSIILEKILNAERFSLKGNVDYFDKAIQFIQPPRILLGAVILLCWFFLANYF
jgi:hypothetical protein